MLRPGRMTGVLFSTLHFTPLRQGLSLDLQSGCKPASPRDPPIPTPKSSGGYRYVCDHTQFPMSGLGI